MAFIESITVYPFTIRRVLSFCVSSLPSIFRRKSAGRTRRFHPRSFRGAGTAWSTRQFERYISVSKVLSAADEQGESIVRDAANERSGSVVAIATKRAGELCSSVSAFALLGRVPGRVQVHLDLGVLRGSEHL